MDNSSVLRMVLKILIVVIIDTITCLLVFSFWAVFNLAVFPVAFAAVLAGLLCLNIVILTSAQLRATFGVPIFASTTVVTAVYYLAIMLFTRLTYLFIRPRSYLIVYLIITLVYIALLAALFISGYNNKRDVARRSAEKGLTLDMGMLLMTLRRSLAEATAASPDGGRAVLSAFNEMEERFQASTPFGRSEKPAVIGMETQIATKLSGINAAASAANAGDGAFYETLVAQLMETKTMIMDREKLMFV